MSTDYGSSNKNNIIPLFIKKLLKNDICFVHGDGLQTRDFVYIDDLCSAIIKCIKNNKISGKTFQIGSGKQTTILNLSKIIAKRISKINNFPAIIKHAKSRKGDVRVNYQILIELKKYCPGNRIPVYMLVSIKLLITLQMKKKYKIANIIEEGFFGGPQKE